jgi:hypothetical protein
MMLKIGDLVRVRYPTDKFFNGEEFIGFITETSRGGHFNKMWCITTGSEHILSQDRDQIEVLNTK